MEFVQQLLELARDLVRTEKDTPPEEDEDRGEAALTELFQQVKNEKTPVMVERVVADIDEIVRFSSCSPLAPEGGSRRARGGEQALRIELCSRTSSTRMEIWARLRLHPPVLLTRRCAGAAASPIPFSTGATARTNAVMSRRPAALIHPDRTESSSSAPLQWELFVQEWVNSLRDQHQLDERCAVTRANGPDVIATVKGDNAWDNYPCKHSSDYPSSSATSGLSWGSSRHYAGEASTRTHAGGCLIKAPQGAGDEASRTS